MHKILPARPQKFFYILALLLGGFTLFHFTAQAQTEVVGLIRQDCTGYTNCYTSLSAWETAYGGINFGACSQGDLVCAGRIAVAQIDGTWTNSDTVGVNIDGWITDSTHYIQITTTPTARHRGIAGTGYRLSNAAIEINEAYVRVDGLEITHPAIGGIFGDERGLILVRGNAPQASDIRLSNNILHGTGSAAYANAITIYGDLNYRVYNNLMYDVYSTCVWTGGVNLTNPLILYNNTITNCNRYNSQYRAGVTIMYSGDVLAVNNIIAGNGYQDVSNPQYAATGSGYNILSRAASLGQNSLTNRTITDNANPGAGNWIIVTETQAGSEDYRLQSSAENDAQNTGTDLSGNAFVPFSTDIDSQARTGAWDIGADEYNGAAPPSCTESWTCSAWSTCSGGTQSQTCADSNNCGTTASRPALSQTCTVTDTQAPSVPTGLVATVVSSSQINLTWTASTDNVGVTGYRIYRNGTQVGTSATANYSNTGLTASTAYSFTVAAYDAAGNVSAQTSAIGATTSPTSSTPPPTIQTLVSSVDGGTLGIPRWKMFMDPANSNRLWALVANDHDQLLLSNDGGVSWIGFTDSASQTYASRYAGEIDANIDYHASLSGDSSGNLFVVYPTSPAPYTLQFRRISSPANASPLIGSEWSVPVDANYPKSGNVVVTDTDVWVFSRTSYETTAGNVRYSRYDKNGNLLSQGFVTAAGSFVRIGAINYKGNPLVVVWYCSQKLRYFLWNGTSFTAPGDSLIWEANTSTACQNVSDWTWRTRNYAFTITSDDTLHASWLQTGNQLRHAWKTVGAAGSWNYDDVYNDTASPQYSFHDFLPAAAAFGRDVFVFYSLEASGSSGLTSDVYYRRWDGSARAWGNQVRVSTDGANNLHANTVAVVNPASDYVPVMWTTGSTWDTTAARFTRISVQAQGQSCTENWTCTAWSACSGSTQTRTCTDANSCGTTTSRPTLSQSCTAQDTTPPIRSQGLPSGILASGTTQATMTVTTNENATCRYATAQNIAYASMTNTFSTTGNISHSQLLSNLRNDQFYSYSIRCQDTAGNANTNDYAISFAVRAIQNNDLVKVATDPRVYLIENNTRRWIVDEYTFRALGYRDQDIITIPQEELNLFPAGQNIQLTCTPVWTCTAWSTCSNGTQSQACTDANACGTTTNRPELSQSCGQQTGIPTVSTVSGTVSHGNTVTISGSNFGAKVTAAPYVWDDASGNSINEKWDFAYPYTNDAAYRLAYRTPQEVTKANGVVGGVPLPHSRNTKYIAGAHYNSGSLDTHSGNNVVAGKNNQQGYTYSYISFYRRTDPDWHLITNCPVGQEWNCDHNYKEYDYAAGWGYMGNGPNIYLWNSFYNPQMQWGGNYIEGMNVTIYSVNTSLIEWYPQYNTVFSKISVPSMLYGWQKVELILKHNSATGFHKVYQDNRLVWDINLDDDDETRTLDWQGNLVTTRSESVFGGYAREAGNTELFKNNWRYYSDVYYDHSLARVMLANNQNYELATIVEPQIPSAWSGGSIATRVNLGRLSDTGTAYVFIFNETNGRNAVGYPVTLGGGTPVADTQAPTVPTNLSATVTSSSQINLTWIASTDNIGVAGYRIYRNGTQVGTSATANYSNTGLTAATTYSFSISAYDATGNASAQTSAVSARTPNALCTENWTCASWGACSQAGSQSRTCTDSNSCGTTTNRPTLSQSCVSPSTVFSLNDLVQTNASLNVRATPSISGTLAGNQALGNRGTIIGGSIRADNYWWWQVNYDTGADGWSVEDGLDLALSVCTESWTCTAWSTCSNGTQSQTCTDTNNCGTTTNRPALSQSCGQQTGTPAVSSVSGTVSHGSNIIIQGSSFGAKATAAPVAWDNFENGNLGVSVRGRNPVVGSPWVVYNTNTLGYDPSYSNSILRTGSSRSLLFDFVDGLGGAGDKFLQFMGARPRVYFTYWVYFDRQSTEWTANYKPWIYWGDYSSHIAYSGFGSPSAGDGNLRSGIIDNTGSLGSTLWGSTSLSNTEGKWVRYEVYLEESSPGIANGKYKMWTHSPYDTPAPVVDLDLNNDAAVTRVTTDAWRDLWAFGAYFTTDSRSPNARAYIYEDDVYLDTTQARVEIGDTSSWNTNTHREIQIPSAWSANSISIAMNQGTFASGQQAYLYVVDASGNVNAAGYPITIGGTAPVADTQAPTVPTNLSATAISSSQINLTWAASTDNVAVTGYRIYRNGTQIGTSATANYSNTGLTAATTYSFTVLAYDAVNNNSTQSSSASATTQATVGINPTVSLVSGTLTNNNAVTITGSNFGASAATQQIFDNVESGAISNSWSRKGQLTVDTTNQRNARSLYSGYLNFTDGGWNTNDAAMVAGGSDSKKWTVSYWFRLDPTWQWGAGMYPNPADLKLTNVKFLRWWSTAGDTRENMVCAFAGYSGGSVICTMENIGSQTTYFWGYNNISLGSWHNFTALYDDSSSLGVADGKLKIYYDSQEIYNKTNLTTRQTETNFKRPAVIGFWNSWAENDGHNDPMWLDDMYIRNSWQRVILGNAPTYSASAIREIQPVTAWSDTSVGITLNQGSFNNGQTAYLFIVDDNDTASAGYPITIGGTASVADTQAPSVPTNLTATAISSSQINLTWTASTDNVGVAGYRIYRNGTQVATSATASYSNTGLTAATTYSFTVAAYDATGNASAQTSAVSARTPNALCTENWTCASWGVCSQAGSQTQTCTDSNSCGTTANRPALTQSCVPPDITAPAISSVSVSSITTNSAVISWQTNEASTARVDYGVSTSYGSQSALQSTMTTAHSANITGLLPNTTYNFRVRDTDASGNIGISSNNTFKTLELPDSAPPSPISGVTITEAGETSTRISWQSAEDNVGVAGYDLRYSQSLIAQENFSGATRVQGTLIAPVSGTTQQYYISTGLTPATTYYFAVVALDAAGNISTISNLGTVTTQSAPATQNPIPSTNPGTVSVPNTPSGGGGGGGYTVYQLSDIIPPSIPDDAFADPLDGQAVLRWKNPKDTDFVRVLIRRSETNFPENKNDGSLAYEGNDLTFTDTSLENGKTYYYSVFAYDRSSNYSSPIKLHVIPLEENTQISETSEFIDTDNDGLTDPEEDMLGTDKAKPDTDNDGYNDKAEVDSGNDPINPKGITNKALTEKLKGKILLQVQRKGEAWYVNPADGKRYYLRNGDFAYQIMRKLSLGITDKDLIKIPIAKDSPSPTKGEGTNSSPLVGEDARRAGEGVADKKMANRLKGKILLQVQQHGEAWYVNPADGKRYYMKDGSVAYEMMKKFGLGAKTSDIMQVPYNRIK